MNYRRGLYIIGLLLGLTLFLRQGWASMQAVQANGLSHLKVSLLVGALGLYMAATVVQMAAWASTMRYLRVELSVRQVVQGYLLAFLPRYIPGTIWGYLSRGEWLAQQCGVSYAVSTIASLLEASTLVLTALGLSALYWYGATVTSPLATSAIMVVWLAALWLNWRLLPILPRYVRWGSLTAQPVRQPWIRVWLWGNGLYIVFWALHGVALLLLHQALGAETSLLWVTGVYAAALSWLIGFVVLIVPAGLGIREVSLARLLTQSDAVSLAQANTIAVFSRLAIIGAELILLFVGLSVQLCQWWQQYRENKSNLI